MQWLAEFGAMSERPLPPVIARPQPQSRSAYRTFRTIPTRWADNDMYGHVNNVVYYGWFDTVVNAELIERGVLDIHAGQIIGFVVETQCNYFAPLAFPQTVEAGLRVAQAGSSSVRYEIALFARGADTAAAQGHLVHVYVDRSTQKPMPLPEALRRVADELRAE
ncbi:acyl-CoA thioester hydrolase [Variovorax sp. GrIS 2.14]